MKNIHSRAIKIIYKGQSSYETNDAHSTADRALNALIEMVESGLIEPIYLHPQVSLEALEKLIKTHFKDDTEIEEGVMDGCYGSRTGKTFKGITVRVDASLFPESWTDPDLDNMTLINPIKRIENFGGKLIEDLDGDQFLEAIYKVFEYKSDNTYNWSGMYAAEMAFDVDFSIVGDGEFGCREGKTLLVAKFHYGGDPRGNYGSTYVFKFDSMEEIYSVFDLEIEE